MISEFINEWFNAHRAEVIAWRRHIHRHPETANQEVETTNFLASILQDYGLQPQRFPQTGLMVDIGPDTELGRLAFRADIDALPVTEVTGLEYTSEVPGKMHACGHDVHTTVALGLACALADFQRVHDLPLGIRVIFQPAEEVWVGGATDVIEWGALEGVHSILPSTPNPSCAWGASVSALGRSLLLPTWWSSISRAQADILPARTFPPTSSTPWARSSPSYPRCSRAGLIRAPAPFWSLAR